MHYDAKNAWRRLGVAKFTESSQRFKGWCIEMDATYGAEAKEGAADGSFAAEAQMV